MSNDESQSNESYSLKFFFLKLMRNIERTCRKLALSTSSKLKGSKGGGGGYVYYQ